MNSLLVDIGNSGAKVCIATDGSFGECHRVDNDKLVSDTCKLARDYSASQAIVSSVGADPAELCDKLIGQGVDTILLGADTPLPFRLGYDSPDTLGADRMAAVAGAMALYPQQNVLVVDAGSCVTYEFLTAEGLYMGGNIAPGLKMRLLAMHEHTALLPIIEPQGDTPLIGYTTATALRTGALRGMAYETEGYLRAWQEQQGNVTLLLTGGDAPLIAPLLAVEARLEPALVMHGLNEILKNTH